MSRWGKRFTEKEITGLELSRYVRPRHVPGQMNKTESSYAHFLDLMQKAGEIKRFAFEPIKFRLADKTFYTPDFMVVYEDRIAFHEVKGFPRDDWRVKWKVCIEKFPEFEWVLVKYKSGQWDIQVESKSN
jgi:hypothetical protein